MRRTVFLLLLKHQAPVFVAAGAPTAWLTMVPSNNALERTMLRRSRSALPPPAAQFNR
jgi:hypothetical protein